MKKVLLILSVLTVTAWTKPQPQLAQLFPEAITNTVARILKFDNNRSPNGSYRYNVQTSDGFTKEETGEIKNPGTDDESLAVAGRYSYVGDDGRTYNVGYIADEKGFQPLGEHLAQSKDEKQRPKLGLASDAIKSLIDS